MPPTSGLAAVELELEYPGKAVSGLGGSDVDPDPDTDFDAGLRRCLCFSASTRVCPPKIASSFATAPSGAPGDGPVVCSATANCV
jgi:hypothetical protein